MRRLPALEALPAKALPPDQDDLLVHPTATYLAVGLILGPGQPAFANHQIALQQEFANQ